MSQYKELAWALDTYDEDDKQRDQIAAILRSLDAQKPVGYWGGAFSSDGGADLYEVEQVSAFGRVYKNLPLYAAPVAAQPTEQSNWQAIQEAQQRYLPLIKAAVELIAQCHQQLEKSPAPQCFGVPYGHLNALRDALLHPSVKEMAAQPQQAKPLSDAEIWADDGIMSANSRVGASFEALRELVRAVEKRYGIKEQG